MVIETMKARAQAQGGGGAQGGGAGGGQGGGLDIDDIAEIVQQVAGLIDGLPPEIKQQLGVQLARGKSVADIATADDTTDAARRCCVVGGYNARARKRPHVAVGDSFGIKDAPQEQQDTGGSDNEWST